jgi:hypothetical protein
MAKKKAHKKESIHEKKIHEKKAGHKVDMSMKHREAESKGMKKAMPMKGCK